MYTGMGHSGQSSGVAAEEAKLFINTIIAAYNAGTKAPSVSIVENTKSKNGSLNYIYRTMDEGVQLDVNLGTTSEEETESSGEAIPEKFAFYVNDLNVIQGTKDLSVWYYKQISESEYKANVPAGGSTPLIEGSSLPLYAIHTDASTGTTYYLQAYSESEVASALKQTYRRVDNNILYSLSLNGDWIDTQMKAASDANTDFKFFIGTMATLKYQSPNKSDENTVASFDFVTFKQRQLMDLD